MEGERKRERGDNCERERRKKKAERDDVERWRGLEGRRVRRMEPKEIDRRSEREAETNDIDTAEQGKESKKKKKG